MPFEDVKKIFFQVIVCEVGTAPLTNIQVFKKEEKKLKLSISNTDIQEMSNLTLKEIEFFETILEQVTKPNQIEDQDPLQNIKSDRDHFQVRVIRDSQWAGGERDTNNQIYEWPKQEYVDSLSPKQAKDLRITKFKWIQGTAHGPEYDFCHAIQMMNNLGEESESYTDKTEPSDFIDTSFSKITTIKCKTNYHHVFAFQLYDEKNKQIGKDIYSKYQIDCGDDEYVFKVPEDETLIGFKVMKSDDFDCKTSKIAFKTLKLLTNEQYIIYERSQNKELPFQLDCANGVDHPKVVNKNINEMNIKVGSLEKLHRLDELTEHLGMQSIKPLYICATIKERLQFYGNISNSQFTKVVKGGRINKEYQKYEQFFNNFNNELIIPADLYQAYRINVKITGKVPEKCRLRIAQNSLFRDLSDENFSHFDLEQEVDSQQLIIELPNDIPCFMTGQHISLQSESKEVMEWMLLTDIRPAMIISYTVVQEKINLTIQPEIELSLVYFPKNFDSFTLQD